MNQVDFAKGGIFRCMVQTAGPMLVAQIASLLYSIVDRIYLGRLPEIGAVALAGIGLCFPLIGILAALYNLLGCGGAPLCAIERGKGNRERAALFMNLAFTMLFWISIAILILCEVFAHPILRALGASGQSLPYALDYLRIYLLGTPFFMIGHAMPSFSNAQGFPRISMAAVLIGAVTNILLDPLFIFVFGWGIRGAAVATVIAQFLSAWVVCRFLFSSQTELRCRLLPLRDVCGKCHEIGEIMGLGCIAFVMCAGGSLVSLACNNMLARYGGDLLIAVFTIVVSVRQLLEMPALAIGEGTAPFLSFNYGAQAGKRILAAFRLMTLLTVGYTAVVWALVEWHPEWFIRIFSSDPVLLKAAVPLLQIYFFGFIFQALQCSAQSTFKATNKKGRAIFFSLFRKVIIVVPLTLILPGCGLGTKGVFWAEPVSNIAGGSAVFLTLLLTLVPELKRMQQQH